MHPALVPIQGVPMLERVVTALESTARVEQIWISIDQPHALASCDSLQRRAEDGRIVILQSQRSPSTSTLAAMDALTEDKRLLVTTADHALLSPAMVETFLAGTDALEPDVAFGLVKESCIQARFPEAVRTYIPFRGARYSGANLFALRTPRARRAAEFWVRAEAFRKQPWKLARAFGISSLVLFALRRLRLEDALTRASEVIGAEIRAIDLPFAEAAIDVDRPADHELVERILSAQAP